MRLKTLAKQIGVTLFIISYIGVIYTISTNEILIRNASTGLQCQIELLKIINNLKGNTLKRLDERLDNLELELDKMISKIEISIHLKDMENTSVFVESILGFGSGTVVYSTNENMYILTCYHVVEEIVELNEKGITFPATVGYYKRNEEGRQIGAIMHAADVIKYDKDIDLALLKIYQVDDNLKVALIAENEPEKGDTIYSVGNPLNRELVRTISRGILANKIEGYYLSDNTITFGNSGGGLFNSRGELIGVPALVYGYGKSKEDESIPESSLGMSINLTTIREFLRGIEY